MFNVDAFGTCFCLTVLVLDHLLADAPFNIKFGGGGRAGTLNVFAVLHDHFGGAIFCPSTVKIICVSLIS